MNYLKNLLFTLLAIVILLSSCYSLTLESFAGMNSNLKKVSYVCSEKTVKSTFEGKVEDETTYRNTYDSYGNLKKSVVSIKGWKTYTDSYTYDSKGNIIKYVDGNQEESTNYTYNEKGLLVKEILNESIGGKTTKTYTYDKNGYLVKTVQKNSDETIVTTNSYKFNSKGYVIEENVNESTTRDNEVEKIKNKYIYSYNSNNKLVKISFSSNEYSDYTFTYSYNSKGQLTKEVYKIQSDTESTNYSYNSENNIVKTSKTGVFKGVTETINYKYDSNGNLIKKEEPYYGSYPEDISSVLNKGKTVTTYKYKKIEKTRYEKGNLSFCYNNNVELKGSSAKPSLIIRSDYLKDFGFDYEIKIDRPGTLVNGIDYKVSYKNNTAPGKATMKITFIGNYKTENPVTLSFNVVKPKLEVTGLKTTKITTTTFSLTWNKFSGAKYYKVEYSADGKKWTTDVTVSTNSAKVTGYLKGTKVQFRVTALDKNKKAISKASAVLKTQALTDAPSIKLSSTKSKTVTVTWSKLHGATKYTVKYSTDNKTWKTAGSTTGTSYTIKSLTGGKKVYVKVYAMNNYNQYGAYSSVKSITVKK